jgi:uncharacterized protein (TIGR00255 family)
MIKSMTGYGKAELEINNKKITIEIKSLNSKQLDINTRLPILYREKEIEIRRLISEKLNRGKVDLSIFSENLGEDSSAKINGPVVRSYFHQLKELSKETGVEVNHETLLTVLRLPDSVKTEYENLNDEEWKAIRNHLLLAISDMDKYRIQEGVSLSSDLTGNIEIIRQLLDQVLPHEAQRIEAVKSRLAESLNAIKLDGSTDQNRFEQELIYYLEKLDFNEEKVRLESHCSFFSETMAEPESNGKKLGFIAQEIGREINTIGSKANHSEIQKIVVQMKDYLERVKEQLLNVL